MDNNKCLNFKSTVCSIPPIAITFVCFNCGSDIVNVLNQIEGGEYDLRAMKIIIVDNFSSDNSVEILVSFLENSKLNIKLIKSHKNLGFGAACNLAFQYVDSKFFLLLNPDIVINYDSISKIVMFAQSNPTHKIYGGHVLDEFGENKNLSGLREPTLIGLAFWALFIDRMIERFGLGKYDQYNFKSGFNFKLVDSVSGCFFLIESNLFRSLNGFDERFFMYSEEVDLCRRARLDFNALPVVIEDVKIHHKGGATTTSLNKLKLLYFHRFVYYKKHWSSLKLSFAKFVFSTGCYVRVKTSSISLLRSEHDKWKLLYEEQKKWKI